MAHLVIVGAGVFGTMHSIFALRKGHSVTLIERDSRPLMASVRNFGMIAVGGRAKGEELQAARRARELWGMLAVDHPTLTFRPCGSIVVAKTDVEMEVMSILAEQDDAADREWKLLDRDEARDVNPALRGNILGGLFSGQDAAVEPESVLTELRDEAQSFTGFTWVPATEIVDVTQHGREVRAVSREGVHYHGDYAIVVPGADHHTLFGDRLAQAPLKKTYVQMARMAPPSIEVTTGIANGDSLRYYPGYRGPWLEKLPEQSPLGKELVLQLLLQQRVGGTLTIGDSHQYVEPFDHELREDAYEYLVDEIEAILGEAPPIISRWAGVYSQHTEGALAHRDQIDERIHLVTGPAGRGNTLSPMIAEQTIEEFVNV
jgi:FAD dependent oxidoreductase TIGR03364